MIESPIHSVLIAAGELSPLVQDLGLCIVASAVFGVVFERLRIPTIAALLGAGVLLGPIGLSLVHSQANIETIANLGLTLLLFVIGLEVNPAGLLGSGRTMVMPGTPRRPASRPAAIRQRAALNASRRGSIVRPIAASTPL